jgi:hypothetical protein
MWRILDVTWQNWTEARVSDELVRKNLTFDKG